METVSILHIGDTHRRMGSRADDIMAALVQIVDIVTEWHQERRDIGCILWPGDIYHGKTTTEDRNAMIGIMMVLASMAPVVIVPGNHDEDGELEVFRKLNTKFPVIVQDRPDVVLVTSTRTSTAVYVFCLPYPHRAGFMSAGIAKIDTPEMGREVLDQMCLHGADELRRKMEEDPCCVTCVAAHVNVAGAIASTGQPQIGKEIELAQSSLDRFAPETYIALNHIHKHQQIGRGVYAGSICRMDFSENDPKGVVEVSFWSLVDSAHQQRHTWKFVELEVPRQVTVSVLVSASGYTVDDHDHNEDIKGADVRLKYRYARADASVVKPIVEALKARFLDYGVRSVTLIGSPIVTTELRAPAVSAAQSINDKVIAWCALEGVEWNDRMDAKLAALLSEVP